MFRYLDLKITTPVLISNAENSLPFSFKTPPKVCILNDNWCKTGEDDNFNFSKAANLDIENRDSIQFSIFNSLYELFDKITVIFINTISQNSYEQVYKDIEMANDKENEYNDAVEELYKSENTLLIEYGNDF